MWLPGKQRWSREQTSLQIRGCMRLVFMFILWCHALPSSRWCIHFDNITLRAETEITGAAPEKLFHNVKSLHKDCWTAKCLWHHWRPLTSFCQAGFTIHSIFHLLGTVHLFFFYSTMPSLLLMQQLTGRQPVAPLLDKVGAGRLMQAYLIKDSISPFFFWVSRHRPASSCFSCFLNPIFLLGDVVRQPVAG